MTKDQPAKTDLLVEGRAQLTAAEDAILEQAPWRARARAGYLAEIARPESRPRPMRSAIAAALAVAATVALGWWWQRETPLTFSVGAAGVPGAVDAWIAAEGPAATPVVFSEGSTLSLETSSRARVVAVSPRGASVVLERGKLRAWVTPKHNGRWRFSMGPFEIRVTGTRFTTEWDPAAEALTVTMLEGSVVVSGCGTGEHKLAAKQTLRSVCRANRAHVEIDGPSALSARAAEPPAERSAAPTTKPVELPDSVPNLPPSPPAVAPSPVEHRAPTIRRAPADWRLAARAGDFADAYRSIGGGRFDDVCNHASAEDLLLLSDVARHSGAVGQAKAALQRLRARFPHDVLAARAAFGLGRIAFDDSHSYAEAATLFETALREDPSGPLARETFGRTMESRSRSGDVAGARTLARQYLQRYPKGPHAAFATRLLKEGP
jgi:transmembrane sensor